MSQRTNSPSSPETDLEAVADIDEVFSRSNTASKLLPAQGPIEGRSEGHVKQCQNDEEDAPDPLGIPLETPQEWEPEVSDFEFDFTASPGAEEWQIGETGDGCAVYSAVGARVAATVEFQKWDW